MIRRVSGKAWERFENIAVAVGLLGVAVMVGFIIYFKSIGLGL